MNKTYNIHVFLFAVILSIVATVFVSCSREENYLIEGPRIKLEDMTLTYGVEGAVVITKAEQSVQEENSVKDMYVFLYDGNNKLIRKKSYWVGPSKPQEYDETINISSEKLNEGDAPSSGVIPNFFNDFTDIDILRNGNLTFCAVANMDEDLYDRLKALNDDSDINNLKNIIIETTSGNVSRTNFLMTSVVEKVSLDLDNNGTVASVGVNLPLKRVDSKITFNLTVDIANVVGEVKFTEMQYRVHLVPCKSYLFGQDSDVPAQSQDFACMNEDISASFDTTYDDGGGKFTFYMFENRPIVENPITEHDRGDASSLYALREAWIGAPNSPVHGREFKYAPDNATFVEISGHLSYVRPSTTIDGSASMETVDADVTYIVHLGETGNNPNDPVKVNNYDARRNYRYIYNVTVKGINDLEVEVDTGEEYRPGSEGDVVLSSDQRINCDAHYARFLLTLDKKSVEEGNWTGSSPMAGPLLGDDGTVIISTKDYKWILFAINKHFSVEDDKMVKFPGVQAYDGGVQLFTDGLGSSLRDLETIKRELNEDVGHFTREDFAKEDNYWATYYNDLHEDASLRDINQLINYLKQNINDSELFDKNGKVVVTAFCDEYTYLYDPEKDDYVHPGISISQIDGKDHRRLNLWTKYANARSRTLNINPMSTTSVSPDGNTSVTRASISVSQTSIKTIYSTSRAEEMINQGQNPTAWGLETLNETGPLPYQENVVKGSNSASDGRNNFIDFWDIGNAQWTDVMTIENIAEDSENLKGQYKNALQACITRNRDLDGNNKIDENEIFWYLAAKDQLSGLWIGQDALPKNAWMYQGDGTTKTHLITSSTSSQGQNWMLWAEEGASWGSSQAHVENPDYGFDYRCIRNLGIDIAAPDQSPQHYAEVLQTVNLGGYDAYKIDMSYLNPNALRTDSDGGGYFPYIPIGHERSQNNEPFSSFYAMKGIATGNETTWNVMMEDFRNNINPCPRGWRVPNQREMLIMMSTLTAEHDINDVQWIYKLGTSTTFSYNNNGTFYNRVGFMTSYDGIYGVLNLILMNQGDADQGIYLRCVRDAD